MGLEVVEAAFGHQTLTVQTRTASEVGLLCGNGIDGELTAEALAAELLHIIHDRVQFLRHSQIALLKHEDDVSHPVAVHFVQKLPSRSTPWIHGGENEDH